MRGWILLLLVMAGCTVQEVQVTDSPVETVELGESYALSADYVVKEIAGQQVRMMAYNGMVPGPLLKARQGEQVRVEFTNNLDQETTVHWHGIRLDNQYDGVPGVTQAPVASGESFTYVLKFPDEGIYWYHPHVREDWQQEMGLYGVILVEPEDGYYNPVDNEEVLVLDDMLLGREGTHPFGEAVNHALMGRFGNAMLVNGMDDYKLRVTEGVTRIHLANVANTRTFNFSIPGVKMKLVGGDSGNYEREEFVESVVISPSERYTVEVLLEEGNYEMKSINPHREYTLGSIVAEGTSPRDNSADFLTLRQNEYVMESIEEVRPYFDKEPDLKLILTIDMNMPMGRMGSGGNRMMDMGHGMMHAPEEIEWEDTMPMMNKMSTNNTLTWIIEDEEGNENMDIPARFEVGDKVKIRIFNDPGSAHPMQHPIHFHGNRFLVLEKDGTLNENLVWKDTVLVPVGSTIDILLDITNPGDWMAHCHVAEHLQSGMMMVYEV